MTDKPFVIGVGLPRTGTDSLRTALEKIYGRTHHMKEVMPPFAANRHNMDKFTIMVYQKLGLELRSFDGVQAMKECMKGYAAAVDAPTCFFYKELMEAFPNHKIVYSVRDNEKAWSKSVGGTFPKMKLLQTVKTDPIISAVIKYFGFMSLLSPSVAQFMQAHDWLFEKFGLMTNTNNDTCLNGSNESNFSAEGAERFYLEWDKKIMEEFQGNPNFLRFNAKDGYEPLCKLLGVPVPSESFPRVNSTKELLKVASFLKSGQILVCVVFTVFFAVLIKVF